MFALLLVAVAPPPAPEPAADGLFRLAAREVVCRHEFGRFAPVCEVGLELRWEAPLHVVRVAQTRLTGWTPNTFPSGKIAVTGTRHRTTVRAAGVKRADLTLPVLEAAFTITAAERMLTFTVPGLIAPQPQTQAGITLTPRPPRKLDAVLEFRLELTYPEGHPEFESFESWTANNRCRLVHRDGRTLDTDDSVENHTGRRATLDYRFPAAAVGDLAGWALECQTPGPLREFPVRFKLTDIPLP